MKLNLTVLVIAICLLCSAAAAQPYSIRANRGLNLRAAPSVNAEIAATVQAGGILQVVDHVDGWLKINNGGTVVWLADWVNYSRVEDGDQTSSQTTSKAPSQTGTSAHIDNCCLAGWNCTFDFDFIMGKWTYDDNDGQCFLPRQETVDGVIIEGSELFITGVKHAFVLIRDSSPEWYTYVTTGAIKIREAFGNVGTGTLEQSLNLKDISTYPADTPIGQLAADIVMRNCHIHRWLAGNGVSVPEIEPLADVADCETVSLDDLLDIFSGWLCTQGQDWLVGEMAAYKDQRCDDPRIPLHGTLIDGTETFASQILAALNLLKDRAPHWYAYVVQGPTRIRGGPWVTGSHALHGKIEIAPSHANESTITLAGTLLHEACHVNRVRHIAPGTTDAFDTVEGFSVEENICEVMRVGALKEVDPTRPPNPYLQAALNHYYSNGGAYDLQAAADEQRELALHLLSTLSPESSESELFGNCCTEGWNCTHDQEWLNGYLAYQNNECEVPPQIGSCCYAGWNCTFDFDWIMGRWVYDDNDGQCFSPTQTTVDGVIIEGSDDFIDGISRALQLIKDSSPEWYTLAINGALKIRESPGKSGSGTLERSMNLHSIDTYSPSFSLARLATDILLWNCSLYRWLPTAKVSYPNWEPLAEEVMCETATHDQLAATFS